MQATISATGEDETKRAIRDYVEAVRRGTAALIEEYTLRISRSAKARAPVDTGALRDSIRTEILKAANEIIGRVTAGEGLPDIRAIVQEYGSRYQNAQPYLHPSFEEHYRDFIRDLATLLKTGRMP